MQEYPSTYFRSVDELTALIEAETGHWDTRWFRGCKSPHHTLLPKLFRDPKLPPREGYISVEFRRRARPHIEGVSSAFDWLCAAQHYGIPTRLLDWTESLAVALYFSVRPIGSEFSQPTIWVLDPFDLYQLSSPGHEVIPISIDRQVVANADLAFGDLGSSSERHTTARPLPVAPDFLFRRLSAQNGTFTVQGRSIEPLELQVPKTRRSMLRKFVCHPDALVSVYGTLDYVIPSSDALFPDLEGVSEYIV